MYEKTLHTTGYDTEERIVWGSRQEFVQTSFITDTDFDDRFLWFFWTFNLWDLQKFFVFLFLTNTI